MPEANNQSAPVEGTRVEGLYVERLFNLGNYENIKYGVRVTIGQHDNPGRVLVNIENILNDLHAKSGVSDYVLERAKRLLAKPEAEIEEHEKSLLEEYRGYVKHEEDASERRRKSREALAALEYTREFKDHKDNWDDDGRY